MKAMVLKGLSDISVNRFPLEPLELPIPQPSDKELLIRVHTCGVCHTELDEIEGRTPPPVLPVVPGHQVVGTVVGTGKEVRKFNEGDRVGVAWIFSSCRKCEYCLSGNENLCKDFRATGRDANGGYAEYMVINEDYAHAIPAVFTDLEAAPLLCAGAVGYRALRLSGLKDGGSLGLTGFGASAHLVLQIAKFKFPNSQFFVFARSEAERQFARELGALWAGDSAESSPSLLDAIIDTTPVWKPVVEAMKNLKPGGRMVINAIRKEEVDKEYLKALDYSRDLWMEKEIKSVANVALADVREFLELAARVPLHPEVQAYPLECANQALVELKHQKIRGAKVLQIKE